MRHIAPNLIATLLFLFSAISSAAAREARGVSQWSGGHGDCGENQGVGGGGNGTGYLAEFRINTTVNLESNSATFHFVGYNGKEFFGPLTGPLDGAGGFDAKARYESNDEDYRYQGKLNDGGATGTFTRLAHFIGQGNGGPRCTATWTVTFKEGAAAEPAAPATPHPTTVSKPPLKK
jgi:hypothetical protein